MKSRFATISSSTFIWQITLSGGNCICNTKSWMSGMVDVFFFRALVQRENQDVLFTRRMLRRLTWIRFCVLILSRLRVRTFTVWFLCHAFMIDLAIVWDVAFLLIEMCPWWCVCADVYRTISCYYVSVHLVSFSLFRLYFGVRELCVARFVVLQLLFWLAIVEGGCISRIMYMQVKCMKRIRACNLSI